jgi:hypothetical protein
MIPGTCAKLLGSILVVCERVGGNLLHILRLGLFAMYQRDPRRMPTQRSALYKRISRQRYWRRT